MPYKDPEKQKQYWKNYAQENIEKRRENKKRWINKPENREKQNKKVLERYHATKVLKGRTPKPPKTEHQILNEKIRYKELKYGINFWAMWKDQDGLCPICLEKLDIDNILKNEIDHNHKTGEVRGILHPSCNYGLGRFKDDIIILQRAINYLTENKNYGNLRYINNRSLINSKGREKDD